MLNSLISTGLIQCLALGVLRTNPLLFVLFNLVTCARFILEICITTNGVMFESNSVVAMVSDFFFLYNPGLCGMSGNFVDMNSLRCWKEHVLSVFLLKSLFNGWCFGWLSLAVFIKLGLGIVSMRDQSYVFGRVVYAVSTSSIVVDGANSTTICSSLVTLSQYSVSLFFLMGSLSAVAYYCKCDLSIELEKGFGSRAEFVGCFMHRY